MKSITIDNIYEVAKKVFKNKPFTFSEAVKKTAMTQKININDVSSMLGQLYSELVQDGRFAVDGKTCKLTEFMKVDAKDTLNSKLYKTDEEIQVYEDGFQPEPAQQLEDDEEALDEEKSEISFFSDYDDDIDNEEKEKQFVDDNEEDYSEFDIEDLIIDEKEK